VGVCGVVLALAPPAYASCAVPPERSPHAFVGTVVQTEEEGRVATVVTDDGREVTVRGTRDTSWWSDSVSSVDRSYVLGGRYEFHPRNAASPYRDDLCTATRQLAGPPPSAVQSPESWLPDWLPVDAQAGPVGYAAVAAALSALLVLAVLVRKAVSRT
jgi:hypothetical protein